MRMKPLFLAIFLATTAEPAVAEPIELSLPIDCDVGRDCWFVNFVDQDPGPGVRDFGCGAHGYDGHKGTDIAIRDSAVMTGGVDVIASVSGVVAGVRDGMLDGAYLKGGKADIDGKECGNGVLVRHADGWETQYCHLRRGSVVATNGQSIQRGDVLGQVGLSGQTQFPHVHLSVRKDGAVVDPFKGLNPDPTACGVGEGAMWSGPVLEKAPYPPTDFYAVGFAEKRPSFNDVNAGKFTSEKIPATSPVLIFYAAAYWVAPGDVLRLRLVGPDGAVIAKSESVLKKRQARRFAFAGKKRPGEAWPAGVYKGFSSLIRGQQTYEATRTITLTAPVEDGG